MTAHRCAEALNSLHSTLYFAPELEAAFAPHGVADQMAVYLAARAAPMGAVGAGPVVAAFNAFARPMVAGHLPALWERVAPASAVDARYRAVDAVLRRLLGEGPDGVGAPQVAEAAELALRATEACDPGGRPMYAANADLPVPDEPHLALWHAATLLREYRGDGHVAVLACADLAGLDALVTHCASPAGMPQQLVMTKRGWTEHDWARSQNRLREQGLLDAAGALTPAGTELRAEVELETDRLDRAPYDHLGPAALARLTELSGALLGLAASAFPPVLREFFVPA
ncbi:SCO6745 family protein [Actinokineospora diospyrosa]|uniref:SalK n=1 Tax=Actinokineospora diospyrosa TaxID=103728 RepID=A0ABT1IES4_9PSEU|nr:hypothetical protein [Actinokineospora diospyrosa]MCP2270826.1 hypothetical protein [Actinokineospora diospyrosa]